ncbi:MAG: di-heme enzyme [Labilithrix sp.]|nr:di-heme enzyme [Labilithrix sp.]
MQRAGGGVQRARAAVRGGGRGRRAGRADAAAGPAGADGVRLASARRRASPSSPRAQPDDGREGRAGAAPLHDRRLSSTGELSCATCHVQRRAFADPRRHSVGVDGRPHPRSAPSLANAGYHARYNWAAPALRTLEDQLVGPLFGEGAATIEMGLTTDAARAGALARLRADEAYVAAFAAAFPDREPWGFDEVILAVACFERALVSMNAPVDRFRRGERDALSFAALRGAEIFNTDYKGAVCHHCHNGITFTNDVTHQSSPFDEVVYTNVGLYNVGGTGDYPAGNQGLYETTKNPADRGKFRTPTLRNVSVTAPYMHDGSVATLAEVVEHYQTGGRLIDDGPLAGDGRVSPLKERGLGGMRLDEDDIRDLLAFVEALTDADFLADPRFANPEPQSPFFGE